MRTDVITKRLEVTPDVRSFIEEKSGKLSCHLAHFPEDLLRLKVSLERNPHKEEYTAHLNLSMPQTVLKCSENAADLFTATKFAFEGLIRRAEKLKSRGRQDKKKLAHFKRQ
ncbi:MAG: ribosome-associated translation inhibitor RaiA [Candidatus Omnitrophica bacterium]|nr:ribosome-associated translation inhibitor RaiA [Candidatus Omnitrophota bacterium]